MGVIQLWQILAPVQQHRALAELDGLTLAVDLSIWVCENQGVKQMQGVVAKPFLRNLFFRICHLTQLGVKLVFVIEGSAPELKWEVMMKRQQSRFPGRQGKQPAQRPAGKQSRRNFNSCLKECCDLLDILGIPYIQSKGEAEAMCALLNTAGLVDGCLTNDGDAFLYGAQTIFRNFTMNNKDPHVEMYTMSDISSKLGLDRQGLIALGLLLGCDFLPKGVPGIGMANAIKLLQTLQGMDALKRLQKWRGMSEGDCVNQVEIMVRRKALAVPDFPQMKVIEEFLVVKDRCPTRLPLWRRPVPTRLQEFALVKLEWPVEYTLEKVLPLLTLWDMQDILKSLNPSTHQHLKPHRIVKTRVRQGIPCYEVEWGKPVTDTSNEGSYYVTVEKQDLFSQCHPHVVDAFTVSQLETKKKPKGKKKKKAASQPVDVAASLENLSFNFGKMDLKQVTSTLQKSVEDLHPSFSEYDEGSVTQKVRHSKFYSTHHVTSPSTQEDHHEMMSGKSEKSNRGGFHFGIESTVPTSECTLSVKPCKKTLVESTANLCPLKVKPCKTKQMESTANLKNSSGFIPRGVEEMKMTFSGDSQSSVNISMPENSEMSLSDRVKMRLRNKNVSPNPNMESRLISREYLSNQEEQVCANGKSLDGKLLNGKSQGQSKTVDMGALVEDIGNLSLLRNAVSTDNVSHGEAGRGKSPSCKAPTKENISSHITQKECPHKFKMSSPMTSELCNPFTFMKQSSKDSLSDSFEIKGTPKTAGLVMEQSAVFSSDSSKMSFFEKPDEQVVSRTAQGNGATTPLYNISELDSIDLGQFGDFNVQNSLLNNLCASLIQALTPKGILKEEYDCLVASLQKLDDEDCNNGIGGSADELVCNIDFDEVEKASSKIKTPLTKDLRLKPIVLSESDKKEGNGVNQNSGNSGVKLTKTAKEKLRKQRKLLRLSQANEMSKGNVGSKTSVSKSEGNIILTPNQQSKTKSKKKRKSSLGEKSMNGNRLNESVEDRGKSSLCNSSREKSSAMTNSSGNICNANVEQRKNSKKNQSETNSSHAKVCIKTQDNGNVMNSTICMNSSKKKKNRKKSAVNESKGEGLVEDNMKENTGVQKVFIENRTSMSTPDPASQESIDSEDTEQCKKKKKKRKKKKVKKATLGLDISEDEILLDEAQNRVCSEYLRQALENSQKIKNKIEKASPIMDFSADETLLELEAISGLVTGLATESKVNTRLKLKKKLKKSELASTGCDVTLNAVGPAESEGGDGLSADGKGILPTVSHVAMKQSGAPVMSMKFTMMQPEAVGVIRLDEDNFPTSTENLDVDKQQLFKDIPKTNEFGLAADVGENNIESGQENDVSADCEAPQKIIDINGESTNMQDIHANRSCCVASLHDCEALQHELISAVNQEVIVEQGLIPDVPENLIKVDSVKSLEERAWKLIEESLLISSLGPCRVNVSTSDVNIAHDEAPPMVNVDEHQEKNNPVDEKCHDKDIAERDAVLDIFQSLYAKPLEGDVNENEVQGTVGHLSNNNECRLDDLKNQESTEELSDVIGESKNNSPRCSAGCLSVEVSEQDGNGVEDEADNVSVQVLSSDDEVETDEKQNSEEIGEKPGMCLKFNISESYLDSSADISCPFNTAVNNFTDEDLVESRLIAEEGSAILNNGHLSDIVESNDVTMTVVENSNGQEMNTTLDSSDKEEKEFDASLKIGLWSNGASYKSGSTANGEENVGEDSDSSQVMMADVMKMPSHVTSAEIGVSESPVCLADRLKLRLKKTTTRNVLNSFTGGKS